MGVYVGTVAGLVIGYLLGLLTMVVYRKEETEMAYNQGYIEGYTKQPRNL
jgi:hypothetical protein